MSGQLIAWIIAGAVIGWFWHGLEGAVAGAILGFFAASITELRKSVERLAHELRGGIGPGRETSASENQDHDAAFVSDLPIETLQCEDLHAQPSMPDVQPAPLSGAECVPARQADTELSESSMETLQAEDFRETASAPGMECVPDWQAASGMPAGEPSFIERKIREYIRNFFITGNVVARIGLIVLFFGVAFLLKYVASRGLIPVELRLCSVAAGGVVLLVLGWRLRSKKLTYALLLQGGGVGVLYLTVFTAVKLYALVPPAAAFLMMVAIVVLAGMLAVLQDARSLAVFGACGGFLAPVLISSGGSHVMLFSYYALLNAGVLGTAWYKAWRGLNLTGFIFTFVIGAIWGASYYRPEYFSSTEPFLVLFFLMYAAISVLFALRQPPRLKGLVDGTLVFGLPLVAFGLQSALVKDFEYGLALSAVVLAAFYIATAAVLWKKQSEGMRLLAESFLALGVVFGSLAIPLAFDSFWTSGCWALEGGALVWIGLRQSRCFARNFGLLLQLCAGMALCFGTLAHPEQDAMLFVNRFYFSCLMLGFAGFFSNYCHGAYRERLMAWERPLHGLIMAWALVWWFGGGLAEIKANAFAGHGIFTTLVYLALSCGALSWLNRRLAWSDILFVPMGLLPSLIPLTGAILFLSGHEHPFALWGLAAWLPALGINYYLLKAHEQTWPKDVMSSFHVVSLLLVTILLTVEASYWCGRAFQVSQTWQFVAWCIVPGGIAASLYAWGRRGAWPVHPWQREYLCTGTGIVSGFLALWALFGCLRTGSPAPLPYVPLFNPLELAQAAAFVLIWKWYRANRSVVAPQRDVFFTAFAAASFVCLNAAVARTVHFWVHVPFDGLNMWNSAVFQAAVSIIWTLTTLGATTVAVRMQSRRVWFAGAGLAVVVVVKLFCVDLADIGTVARIISFIGVGVLLLVVGYFAPLPPRHMLDDVH